MPPETSRRRVRELFLERLRWPEIGDALRNGYTTAIVPCGAVEQHGPHLPLFMDTEHGTLLGAEVARRLLSLVHPVDEPLARRLVATAIGVTLRGGMVHAEGDLDFRGTLGVDKDAPVGFETIRLSFELDSDADEEQLATLIKLTERYCVVYQTLRRAPPVALSLHTGALD